MECDAQRLSAGRGGLPVLSNIYLDRLDKFAETVLIPEYTRGEYQGVQSRIRAG